MSNAQFSKAAKAKNEKVDSEDVGEAYAISQCADASIALIQTDELKEQGKYLIKTIKSRFGSKGKVFTVGINYDRMRLHNLSADEQEIPLHLRDQLKAQQQKKNEKEESILFDFN